jgi:putative transposase
MKRHRKLSHSLFELKVHLVWITKYRYKVLKGPVGRRVREIIRQDCERLDISILSGVVSSDHIHLFLSYPPKYSISKIVKQLKGRSSKKIQGEFLELRKKYWGRHFWGIGYAAFSSGNITDEIIKEYIENHTESKGDDFEVTR